MRMRIDNSRCDVLALRVDYRCGSRSRHVRAKRYDLAVFHIYAAILDSAVRSREQDCVLDDKFVLAAVRGGKAGRLLGHYTNTSHKHKNTHSAASRALRGTRVRCHSIPP